MSGLILPVGERRMSSWRQHIRRYVPSQEPGTDFYCPIGTEIVAPYDGYIFGSGNSIVPATGRWVGIQFDNGMPYRSMHHKRNIITSGRVRQGEVYAISGASGYGEEDWSWNPETGGAHVHATLWPDIASRMRFGYRSPGIPYTIDMMDYIGKPAFAGEKEDEEMTPEQWAFLQAMNVKLDDIASGINVLAVAVKAPEMLTPGMNDKLDDLVGAAEKLLARD